MATYIILNCLFLLLCSIVLRITPYRPSKVQRVVGAILLAATALFDSILIASHIISYDATKLLGVYIGKAPIEDFFYTVAAILIVPVLWKRFNHKVTE